MFLAASISRYPLEGYREKCTTKTVLGTRFAKKPIELDIPITIAGMSFGALSANVKEALGRAATEVGTSTTTGDGGMTRGGTPVVQDARLPVPALALRLQSRRSAAGRCDRARDRPGRQARRRRHAAGPEGEPARRARCARCPKASTSARPAGIPDWTGPDDLAIKILELREITDWEKPIYVKIGATRVFDDVKLACTPGPT